MSIITELEERGFIHSITDRSALEALLDTERVTFYCGFDPTADSLHVGSLLPLILMRRLALKGHKALVLLGSEICSPLNRLSLTSPVFVPRLSG